MKMKSFGLTESKLFHFHRIFKNVGQGGGSSQPHESPMDPPLQNSRKDSYGMDMLRSRQGKCF